MASYYAGSMMKNSVMTFILALTTLLFSPQGWATSARELRQIVRDAYKTCGSMNCQNLKLSLEEIPAQSADPTMLQDLSEAAFDLAQVWGDTILESDYEADEEISMDRIEVVRIDGDIAGFRLSYSANAYDHANKIPGRIRESGFVTSDGSKGFADPKAFAEFIPQNSSY